MKKKIPGTIYKPSNTNRLYIKYRSVRYATGLPDSKENRRIAEEMIMQLWRRDHGMLDAETMVNLSPKEKKPTFFEAYKKFEIERYARLNEQTKSIYEYAFDYLVKKTGYLHKAMDEDSFRQILIDFQNADHKLTSSSRRIILINFRVFHKWSCRRYKIEYNNTLEYAPPPTKKLVKVYSEHEYLAILDYFDKQDREFSLLLRFMLATGFRIGETVNMKWSQIKQDCIEVPNKLNKEQIETFPLSRELSAIVEQLRSYNNKERLFRWSGNSVSSLRKLLNRAFDELDIEKDGRAFHVFRKTFNKRLLLSGVALETTRELMRHKSIDTTIKHYTLITEQEKNEALNALTKI